MDKSDMQLQKSPSAEKPKRTTKTPTRWKQVLSGMLGGVNKDSRREKEGKTDNT